jgi:hypothetical protein
VWGRLREECEIFEGTGLHAIIRDRDILYRAAGGAIVRINRVASTSENIIIDRDVVDGSIAVVHHGGRGESVLVDDRGVIDIDVVLSVVHLCAGLVQRTATDIHVMNAFVK